MGWKRGALYLSGLIAAWALWTGWQLHEYGHERELARDALRRQSDSVMSVLIGAIRSHRRLGRFFEEQIESVLAELVESEDVRAVAILSQDGSPLLAAGETERFEFSPQITPGNSWPAAGFQSVVEFHVEPAAGAGPYGGGGGRGRGRGRWLEEDDEGPFAQGGQFAAALLLDRTGTDLFSRHALWLRLGMSLAGGVVLLSAGLAWLATVRMTAARGRARVLEAEARHLRDLSQAAAGLAHETRNPLGLIRGWTQRLAQAQLGSDEQRDQARAILEECDRVTSRINQFLAFARPCEPSPEPVDPDEVITELNVLLEPDLETKGLTLKHTPATDGTTVQADREMLRQALFNLVSNAIQFTPASETVEIVVRAGNDGGCRLEVADRGPGVAPEDRERLFTPYFTTRANGTGLGLAIVRRIAAAHGWGVGHTPRPGGGSIFWLDCTHG